MPQLIRAVMLRLKRIVMPEVAETTASNVFSVSLMWLGMRAGLRGVPLYL